MSAQLTGVITSLVTPFATSLSTETGLTTEIDTFRVKVLIECQARAGVAAVAVAGWVGEGPTLTDGERRLLVETAVAAKGPLKVLAHIGSPSTARSISLADDAEAAGADALILVVPYYNRPSHAGIRGHVAAVAEATRLPLYIEIDEAATNVRLSVAEIGEMTRIDGVAGVLDHSTNPLHVECMSASRRGTTFFAAYEPTAAACGLLGADGIFSAAANISPTRIVALWRAIAENDVLGARERHAGLQPLMDFTQRHGVAGLKDLLQSRIGSERTVRGPLQPLEQAEQRDALALSAVLEGTAEQRVAAR